MPSRKQRHQRAEHLLQLLQVWRVLQRLADGLAPLLAQVVAIQAASKQAHAHARSERCAQASAARARRRAFQNEEKTQDFQPLKFIVQI